MIVQDGLEVQHLIAQFEEAFVVVLGKQELVQTSSSLIFLGWETVTDRLAGGQAS